MLARMWNNRNSHTLLIGMQNGTSTLEDSFVGFFFYKIKHTLSYTIQQLCSLVFTQRSWKLVATQKPTHNVYNNFIIAKTWKQPRCLQCMNGYINCGTSRQWNIIQGLKINALSSHEKIWRNLKFILLSESSQSEKAIYCMIPTKWHPGKHKTKEMVKRSVVGSGCVRWMNRWSTEDILGIENTLYIMMMNTRHYTFVQTHRKCNTKNEM